MFLDIDKKERSSVAALDNLGNSITYGEIRDFSNDFSSIIKKRCLVFILTENTIVSLKQFYASVASRVVPLLLSSNIDRELLNNLIEIYKPAFLIVPDRISQEFEYRKESQILGYTYYQTGFEAYKLYENLSMLLTTSGSTGSPKLVRHSYLNIEANARNIAAFFKLTPEDKAISILPMHYTMGLSVIYSHLYAGATILLYNGSLTDIEFWDFLKNSKATSFTGVPYNYEVLHKLRFLNMNLPHLKLLTQGGGKLREDIFKAFAEYACKNGKKFIATYGQTEGTARMAYLKPEMALSKVGSIGKAIPNGHFYLADEKGMEITGSEASGELIYTGPNVTLGYALKGEDLKKEDENKGVLKTGDIARRDCEGYFYIVGRKNRFLKLFGIRIGLDETEQLIKSKFNIESLCTGTDEKMTIITTNGELREQIATYILEKTGLFHGAIEIQITKTIPRNETGKLNYHHLNKFKQT